MGAEVASYERRQVVDVPPLRALRVTEHRAQRKRCAGCGGITAASFPAEASATVVYGPRLKALSVYLMVYQLLPYERASELLLDQPRGGGDARPCGSALEGWSRRRQRSRRHSWERKSAISTRRGCAWGYRDVVARGRVFTGEPFIPSLRG